MDELLKEAELLKNSSAELKILDRKCRYFYSKRDAEKLLVFSDQLKKKAEKYGDFQMQAMAHVCIAETYAINQFYDKSIAELETALTVIEKADPKNMRVFLTKVNALSEFANVYNSNGQPEKAVEKLLEVVENYDKISDPEDVREYQYVNYSNLASTYALFDIEKAKYYALKSNNLRSNGEPEDKITMTNYFVLGMVCKEQKEFKAALDYFLKSYELSKVNGILLNQEELFTNLIEIYKEIGDSTQTAFFEEKFVNRQQKVDIL